MDARFDLHIHSTFSDGIFTPEKLLYMAKDVSLSGLSITDHDTIFAYSDKLFDLAKNLNLTLLTGVEISSFFSSEVVHILGYGFDYKSKELLDFLKDVREKRKKRNLAILEKLSKNKMVISENELYKNDEDSSIGRPHIANIMAQKGYVKTFQEAFDGYLKEGAKCYVEGEKFSPEKIISKLHSVKAKAVLAHPHLIKDFKIIKELLTLPFDGIEAYYGKITPDKEKRWIKLAEKENLLITGGSDYHGDFKSYLTLGCSWISKERFDQLIS